MVRSFASTNRQLSSLPAAKARPTGTPSFQHAFAHRLVDAAEPPKPVPEGRRTNSRRLQSAGYLELRLDANAVPDDQSSAYDELPGHEGLLSAPLPQPLRRVQHALRHALRRWTWRRQPGKTREA
jgi:hypothetical protein